MKQSSTHPASHRTKTYDLVYIGIFTVLIAVCSWISIPLTVPVTLQTFGVFAAVGILGGKRGTIAVLVYILMGAIGIPVFSGFTGGLGILAGTTGGYIAGFLFSALLMWGMEKLFGRSTPVLAVSMVLGLILCYAVGTVWFMIVYTGTSGSVGLLTVLGWCVFPFLIPDAAKIALALLMTKRLSGVVRI
ncbi:biotin transporter BioY [Ruminococcus sp. CLA-AA-H200]|uniref:Biotin transporter n=2 Tax=Ruminococcus turbiniformis TaxID=2881258 RepID=A0ABS8FT73_9FIRM|nr:biotin transporter BioY [Ruminococcus turbiniformis]MCC2253233.1 biotin transporter BioY [Ruminococcus turbiniformis]